MGYPVENNTNVTALQSAIAGGGAGALTRAVAQPLDVLKIRFQLQLEPLKYGLNSSSRYCSTLQAVRTIIKEEGLSTLWSGHVPAQLLSISYGVLQFTVFEQLSQQVRIANPKVYADNKNAINFANGAIAATLATVVSFPFDTVRTRLIAEQKTHKAYRGFSDAWVKMICFEGYSALFKGLLPTLGQIAPYAGLQFLVYKFMTENILTKHKYFQRNNEASSETKPSLSANMIAGSLAGLVSKTAIYPFDLIKKRLQIQGFQEHRQYFGKQMYCNGVIDCAKLTIYEEGFLALYKGYLPSLLKAVTVSALHFAAYDEIKQFLIGIQR